MHNDVSPWMVSAVKRPDEADWKPISQLRPLSRSRPIQRMTTRRSKGNRPTTHVKDDLAPGIQVDAVDRQADASDDCNHEPFHLMERVPRAVVQVHCALFEGLGN
jgi:hypothetical protein